MTLYSECCNVPDRPVTCDGPNFSDILICPECYDHCEFEEHEFEEHEDEC